MVPRMKDYLYKASILSNCQYGFRPGHSTELAVHDLCQSIYDTLDSKMFQVTLFFYFIKAFNTVSYNIIITKILFFLICGPVNNWFWSYMVHRKQYVYFSNKFLTLKTINYRIPQGSVLGPLLFFLFIQII